MLTSFVDAFINLDENNKKLIISYASSIIFPIKLYLIFVILLLIILCVTNYYIYKSLKI